MNVIAFNLPNSWWLAIHLDVGNHWIEREQCVLIWQPSTILPLVSSSGLLYSWIPPLHFLLLLLLLLQHHLLALAKWRIHGGRCFSSCSRFGSFFPQVPLYPLPSTFFQKQHFSPFSIVDKRIRIDCRIWRRRRRGSWGREIPASPPPPPPAQPPAPRSLPWKVGPVDVFSFEAVRLRGLLRRHG